MVKDWKDILELIVAAFAIIGGLVAAFIFVRKWYRHFVTKKSNFFTGYWSNEGNIGGEQPTHFVDLNLFCYGAELSGSFNVRKTEEDHTWHSVSLSGKRSFSTAKCKITHVRNGQILDYGKVILKKDSKQNLKWILKEGVADFFPKETTLFRSLPVIA